jgi:hypothetical protein
MAINRTAVFGIYSDRFDVEEAADLFARSGYSVTDISVLLPQSLGASDIGTEKATKAPEGAAAGAGSGAVLGGTLGLLAGIGALAIPGVGPLIAAGPIVATLAGIGVGGTVGGFAGAMIGLGIPEYEAKRYEGHLQKGRILFSIHCNTSREIELAKDILQRTGALDISTTSESPTGVAEPGMRAQRKASGGAN